MKRVGYVNFEYQTKNSGSHIIIQFGWKAETFKILKITIIGTESNIFCKRRTDLPKTPIFQVSTPAKY